MSDQVQVLDSTSHQKIPDSVIVRDVFRDFFLHDPVVQRIQFEKISSLFNGLVNGAVIMDSLFKALNRCFPFKVIEFWKGDFPADTRLQDFLVIIDTFDKEKRVVSQLECDLFSPAGTHICGIEDGHLPLVAKVISGPSDIHEGNLFP